MNNYRALVISLFLCSAFVANAQKQYWGTTFNTIDAPGSPLPYGGIIRVDSAGMHPTLVLSFNTSELGALSTGQVLMQATNGLIYGMASYGAAPYQFMLIAIDPVIDSTYIAAVLGGSQYPYDGLPENAGLVQAPNGLIYGGTGGYISGGAVFSYDPISGLLSFVTGLPPVFDGSAGGFRYPYLSNPLMCASNGLIYGAESPLQNVSIGKFSRIDPANGMYATVALEVPTDGFPISVGKLIEYNGKLFATTTSGGPSHTVDNPGKGVILSYDISMNTYTTVVEFDDQVRNPYKGLVIHQNGLLYGEAVGDVDMSGSGGVGYFGCIYSFDPELNAISRVVSYDQVGLGIETTGQSLQPGILSASNGKIYGSFQKGLFEYDPIEDTLRLCASLQYLHNGVSYPHGLQSPLIEICRKPNYKPRPTTSFNVCAGAHFFYDLRNVNATTVVWRRNGNVVPSQTNQRLEFAAITEGDEGVWTCILTNECGITETPAITLTVNAGAFTTPAISGDTLLCGTGDMAALSGNTIGTWSTGVTTPTLSVTQPGLYYAYRQQACGLSMSNAVQVSHADSVFAPTIQPNTDTLLFCPGDATLLTNNDPGPWGTAPHGIWQDGSTATSYTVQDPGNYFVVATNACNSDTSNIIHIIRRAPPAFPTIALRDGFGNATDNLLCSGDSVVFTGPPGAQYSVFQNNSYVGSISDLGTYTATTAGIYQVLAYGGCAEYSDTLYLPVLVDTDVPPLATILPDQFSLADCDQDTAYLSSAAPFSYWTWTDASGLQQTDTTEQLLVDWSIGGNGFYTLYNYNGCGNSPPDFIQVNGTPAPDVQLSITQDSICLSDGAQTLSAGTPTGGTYSGTGVTGNIFNPAAAGIGEHVITYSLSDGNCTGFAQDIVVVDGCTGIEILNETISIDVIPNPNTGTFTIRSDLSFTTGQATLLNAIGEQVAPIIKLDNGSTQVDQKELLSGIYFLRVTLDERTSTLPVVITR